MKLSCWSEYAHTMLSKTNMRTYLKIKNVPFLGRCKLFSLAFFPNHFQIIRGHPEFLDPYLLSLWAHLPSHHQTCNFWALEHMHMHMPSLSFLNDLVLEQNNWWWFLISGSIIQLGKPLDQSDYVIHTHSYQLVHCEPGQPHDMTAYLLLCQL